jgi:hypothetical protein
MIETYKVLGAALALGEFTISELAEFSETNKVTTRTVVDRWKEYFEVIEKKSTGKRGGQPNMFRIKTNSVDEIRGRVYGLFDQIKPKLGITPEPDHTPSIPFGLLAARDVIEQIMPEQKKSDLNKKKEFIELAKLHLDSAIYEYHNDCHDDSVKISHEEFNAYVETISALIEMAGAEIKLQKNPMNTDKTDVQKLHKAITVSTQKMWDLGPHNHEFAFNVMQRVAQSPVINLALKY